MADSSRLEILDLLSCGELCACDLLQHFSFSQPTLSHHMKVLKDNNLITSRKDGNKNLYKLNHDVLDNVTSRLTLLSSCTVPVSYTHLTLPTTRLVCRSRWSPYH